MTISDQSGHLKKLKVAMVITVVRDYLTYPITGHQSFLYSGVFMSITTFNSVILITKTSTQNLNYYHIGYSKYKLFGFSSLFIRIANGEI